MQREEDGEGLCRQEGNVSCRDGQPLGSGSQTLGFKHRMESCSIQLPSSSGVYVWLTPLPSRLWRTLPGKRGIIVALLQHFLHHGVLAKFPFEAVLAGFPQRAQS